MADGVFTQVGSGTIPFVRGILPTDERGTLDEGEGIRRGTQVIIANPEDMVSVDAFAASGISVGTTAVEVLSPANNPLPRSRMVYVQNTGGQNVYISHKQNFTTLDAFELPTGGTAGTNRRVTMPVLHNVSIWAKTATGTSEVRLLIL